MLPVPGARRAGAKSNSFKQLAERLAEYASSGELAGEVGSWREQAGQVTPAIPVTCRAAVALRYAKWSGEQPLRVAVEGHGREQVGVAEISRAVGWFTSVYPVVLEVESSALASLKRVKERLRAVPESGLGFGVLRWLRSEALLE